VLNKNDGKLGSVSTAATLGFVPLLPAAQKPYACFCACQQIEATCSLKPSQTMGFCGNIISYFIV
jgi:hypothetical protein